MTRIALVGDSHAQALAPRLRKLVPGVVLSIARPGWSEARYRASDDLARALDAARPDVVVYLLGGNNQHLAPDAYAADARALVDAARGRPVRWVGPATATQADAARRHEATAALQARVLPGLSVRWLDSRPLTRGGHRSDGVHFTPAAYDAWARSIARWLASARAPRRWWWYAGAAAAALAAVGLVWARAR